MRAMRYGRSVVSFVVFSSLSFLLPALASAQDQPPPEGAPPEAPPPAAAPVEEKMPVEPPSTPAPSPFGVTVGEFKGWKLSIEGRLNTFFSLGWGNQRRATDPNDGTALGEGGGLGLNQNQTNSSGNFVTPRIRNGFVANVLTFKLSRKIGEDTTLSANLSLWSDVETNLSVYLFPATYMQEGTLSIEGPWGSVTAGRQLALFSRGAVEIDYNYAHAYGLGWPCNFNFIFATCGQIGFGVLFPFYRAGVLYATPNLAGLTLSAGMYDPVILAGKWERIVTPTFEAEATYAKELNGKGMFKLFVNGLLQWLGGTSNLAEPVAGQPPPPADTRTTAHKTVKQMGIAGGARFELGPLRLGAAGHYGKGLGFYYAQENSQASYYFAQTPDDPHDGDLRTFRGFYGQLMVVLGSIDLAAGAGVSQVLPLSYEDASATHLAKQNLGINAGLYVHIHNNLVWGLDFFRAQYSWYGSTYTQNINSANTGLTLMF